MNITPFVNILWFFRHAYVCLTYVLLRFTYVFTFLSVVFTFLIMFLTYKRVWYRLGIYGGFITLILNVIQGAVSHPMGLYHILQWPSEW